MIEIKTIAPIQRILRIIECAKDDGVRFDSSAAIAMIGIPDANKNISATAPNDKISLIILFSEYFLSE